MRSAGPRLAVPSFVAPGTVAQNLAFIAAEGDFVDEAELVFFEAEACLAYGPADLPSRLPDGLAVHVHLPLDLDWTDPEAAAAISARLLAKAKDFSPTAATLHPPNDPSRLRRFVAAFAAAGADPGLLRLENTPENEGGQWIDAAISLGLGFCYDVGHRMLAGRPHPLLQPPALDHVRMMHLYAPTPKGRHEGLDRLDAAGRWIVAADLDLLLGAGLETLVLEVFDWAGVLASRDALYALRPELRR